MFDWYRNMVEQWKRDNDPVPHWFLPNVIHPLIYIITLILSVVAIVCLMVQGSSARDSCVTCNKAQPVLHGCKSGACFDSFEMPCVSMVKQ